MLRAKPVADGRLALGFRRSSTRSKAAAALYIAYENQPLLFEARVARELHLSDLTDVQYEFQAGVGESTVDFRLRRTQVWLIEVACGFTHILSA